MELSQTITQNSRSDRRKDAQWLNLESLKITNARQKDDCLYLHCQANIPIEILAALSTDFNATTSNMLADGIRRVKLHGETWALGVDLPLSNAAMIAAAVIQHLLQDRQTTRTAIKVLLKQNCLNVLCESSQPITQAVIALPILNALRQTQPLDYLQSVTVSGRLKGEKLPSWTFDIDLLAIGIAVPPQKVASATLPKIEPPQPEQEVIAEPKPLIPAELAEFCQALIQLRWLITHKEDDTSSKPASQTLSDMAIVVCGLSAVLGVGATLLLDRQLVQYTQTESPKITELAASTSGKKIDFGTEVETPNYNISLLNEKLDLLKWHASAFRQPPDVIIVGSSRALRGVDPNTLEQALARQGYKNLQVFNFGINGATAKVVNLQLTQILSRPQLPKMIIWADGVRAFNSNRTDLTYNEITSSPGYAQLNKNLKTDSQENSESPPNDEAKNSQLNPAKRPVEQKLEDLLTRLLVTYTNREQLRFSLVETYNQTTKSVSNSDALIAAGLPSQAMESDVKGFIGLDIKFDPQTYFQTYPNVPGDYDLDYRSFDINGDQMDAFNALSNFSRQRRIPLVFVNMPLHTVYLDPTRSRYEVTFSNRMRDIATRWNFTYIDLSQAWVNQSNYFSDPSHLNRQGAIAVAKSLAANPNINWQVIK